MRWNMEPHREFDGVSMETETTIWSDFPNGGKAVVEQILASEEKNRPKTTELWEWLSAIRVGKLTIWDRKTITEFTSWSVPPE